MSNPPLLQNQQSKFTENFLKNNQDLFINVPRNSCAYSSTLELMRCAAILKYVSVWRCDLPHTIPVLRSSLRQKEEPRLFKAICEIRTLTSRMFNLQLKPDGAFEDPWVVLWSIKNILNSFRNDFSIMPMTGYICNKCKENRRVQNQFYQVGDLQYVKVGQKIQSLKKTCPYCSQQLKPNIQYLPIQFQVRIRNCSRYNTFEEPSLPQFDDYKINCYIQHNQDTNHFRNIRIMSGRIIVSDNGTIQTLPIQELRNVLYQEKWSNYIANYVKKQQNRDSRKKLNDLPRTVPVRLLEGGSNDFNRNKQVRQQFRNKLRRNDIQDRFHLQRFQIPNRLERIELQIQEFQQVIFKQQNTIDRLHRMVTDIQQKLHIRQRLSLPQMQPPRQKLIYEQKQFDIKSDACRQESLILQNNQKNGSELQQKQDKIQKDEKIHQSPWVSTKEKTMESIEKNDNPFRTKRTTKQQHCAYTASIDLLHNNDWLKYLSNQQNENQKVRQILRNNQQNFEEAIEQIKETANKQGLKFQTHEDPWRLINAIQQMLTKKWIGNNNTLLYPMIECKCKKKRQREDYRQLPGKNFTLRNLSCLACRNSNETVVRKMPNEVLIRLCDESSVNQFNRAQIPKIENYYTRGVIQWSKKKNHFRTIKLMGKTFNIIYDNDSIRRIRGDLDQRRNILNEQDWQNYIVHLSKNNNENKLTSVQVEEMDGFSKYSSLMIQSFRIGGSSSKTDVNKLRQLKLGDIGFKPKLQNLQIRQGPTQTVKQLKILQWNVNSWNEIRKVHRLSAYNPDVAIINEGRAEKDISGFQSIYSLPRKVIQQKINCQVLVKKNLNYRLLIRETNIICIEIAKNENIKEQILVVGLYLNPHMDQQDINDKVRQIAYNQTIKFIRQHPNGIVIIGGDFNQQFQSIRNQADRQPFYDLICSLNKTIRDQTSKRSRTQIDFLFSNRSIKLLQSTSNYISDHLQTIIFIQVVSKQSTYKQKIPNKNNYLRFAKILLENDIQNCTIQVLNKIIRSQRRKGFRLFQKTKKQEDIDHELLLQTNNQQYNQIYLNKIKQAFNDFEKQRFTKNSKQAFKKLRNITKYNQFDKRDGGLMTSAYGPCGKIIQGRELHREVIQHYQEIHNQVNITSRETLKKASLPSINSSDHNIKKMMGCINKNKALGLDGIHDSLFQLQNQNSGQQTKLLNQKKIHFCRSLLNPEYWQKQESKRHFICRLVILNKQFPKTPDYRKYRPIVIQSPVIKFLESSLCFKLRDFLKNNNYKEQHGFVPNVSIQDCRFQLFNQLSRRKMQKRKTFAVFIDFVSAYDKINIRVLKRVLKEHNILGDQQIRLWMKIYCNLEIQLGQFKTCINNGVPQGSIISPALFDVFTITLIQTLRKDKRWMNLFADDLVILVQTVKQLEQTLKKLRSWCNLTNMEINFKKSAIINFDWKKATEREIEKIKQLQIPMNNNYKYLGGTIDCSLKLSTHLDIITRKINYIRYKLHGVRHKNNLKLNINLYKLFVMPLFRMNLINYHYAKKTDRNTASKLMRKTFKSFTNLPFNTPNQIINKMIGNLDQRSKQLEEKCQILHQHNKNHNPNLFHNNQIKVYKTVIKWKYYPKRLISLLRCLYNKICINCQLMIGMSHQKQDPKCPSVKIDLIKMLNDYQDKQRTKQIDTCCHKVIKQLQDKTKKWKKVKKN